MNPPKFISRHIINKLLKTEDKEVFQVLEAARGRQHPPHRGEVVRAAVLLSRETWRPEENCEVFSSPGRKELSI